MTVQGLTTRAIDCCLGTAPIHDKIVELNSVKNLLTTLPDTNERENAIQLVQRNLNWYDYVENSTREAQILRKKCRSYRIGYAELVEYIVDKFGDRNSPEYKDFMLALHLEQDRRMENGLPNENWFNHIPEIIAARRNA